MRPVRPMVLVVCDGWGYSEDSFGNAILAAVTPCVDAMVQRWPWTTVAASGEAVGLPAGQQGNSEVGHLTIGAGRVIFQDLPRITRAIETGDFYANSVLCAAVDRARDSGGTLHLLGLLSPGGVHSHQDQALAVVELARRRGLERVAVHAFTDGRDEPPTSAAGFVARFEQGLTAIGVGRIVSVSGRYWAMDRDQRWERTERAYAVIAGDGGPVVSSALDYIERSHADGVSDEFLEPVSIVPPGERRRHIDDGDAAVFFNFRPDRARQLCHALLDPEFRQFDRRRRIRGLSLATFTEYEQGLGAAVAFPKQEVGETLAEVVSGSGLRQFHVAETEKYAHVTYFINGGREAPFAGEDRLLIPSPKVATYDSAPAMSAEAVTDAVIDRLRGGGADLVIVNFANPDMVGHTGVFDATVRAVETTDTCLGRIVGAATERGGAVLITADHGNAEMMLDRRDNSPLTAHTISPVPLILCGGDAAGLRDGGGLADVAPTVLAVMGLPIPVAMSGRDLRVGAVQQT